MQKMLMMENMESDEGPEGSEDGGKHINISLHARTTTGTEIHQSATVLCQ